MKTTIALKRQDLIDYLIKSPESGMGYQIVDIYMKDGQIIKGFVFNCQDLQVEGIISESNIERLEVKPR